MGCRSLPARTSRISHISGGVHGWHLTSSSCVAMLRVIGSQNGPLQAGSALAGAGLDPDVLVRLQHLADAAVVATALHRGDPLLAILPEPES